MSVWVVENQSIRPEYGKMASGQHPFHSYVVCGYTGNRVPSLLVREFRLANDNMVHGEMFVSTLPPGSDFTSYITRGELVDKLVRQPQTWSGGAAAGVDKLVASIKAQHPECGGRTQLIEITPSRSRWVTGKDGEQI
jgi:hypothetical protein